MWEGGRICLYVCLHVCSVDVAGLNIPARVQLCVLYAGLVGRPTRWSLEYPSCSRWNMEKKQGRHSMSQRSLTLPSCLKK